MAERIPLIAVVDDEAHLRETLSVALRKEGWRVQSFPDGREAWDAFTRCLPDLAVLDILMPRMDGLELCRRIRAVSASVPVLFLTSKDEEFDRVLGLELGADDYLCKPFSLRELTARIRVLFRRTAWDGGEIPPDGPAAGDDPSETVQAGGLTLDGARFRAEWNGTAVKLTVTEFRILRCLARRPGVVKDRDALLAEAFPQDAYMGDRSVDCHIKRIRRKLGGADSGFDGIETVYGLGYRWRDGNRGEG